MTHKESAEKLTPLEKKFVKEYPVDFIGYAAYMRASGTTNKKSAGVQATKLLKKPKVAKALEIYLEDLLGPQEKRTLENVKFWEAVRDGQLPGENLGKMVALADVLAIVDDEELREAIQELPTHEVVKTKTVERLKASENLAKYNQDFVGKTEVDLSGTVQIIDDIR